MKHWACWDEHETFYLTELAPTLIANPQSGDETEQRILRELRAQMRDDEWKNLPRIFADRRAEILREIESEREAAAQAERERIRRKRMQRRLIINLIETSCLPTDSLNQPRHRLSGRIRKQKANICPPLVRTSRQSSQRAEILS
jgi:hypothetical protein